MVRSRFGDMIDWHAIVLGSDHMQPNLSITFHICNLFHAATCSVVIFSFYSYLFGVRWAEVCRHCDLAGGV